MPRWYAILPLAGATLLGACATMPQGPSVMVLPGTHKSFAQFRNDDAVCRQYASYQIGGTSPAQASQQSAINSAALGTLIGAAAGAAIGAASGHAGTGAAVGAGSGLLFGGAMGLGAGQDSAYSLQQRYDFAYEQCMYAKGNRVPAYSGYTGGSSYHQYENPSNEPPPPPPPPGAPPPPPPPPSR